MKDDEQKYIFGNITSNYQSGGITAGIVNIHEKPTRTIAEDQINLIKQHAPQSKKIQLDAIWGDQESFRFALNLQSRLQQDGYQVQVDQVAYNSIPKPQIITGTDPLQIIIGIVPGYV